MGEVSTRGRDGKDVRSAAQIEEDIARTREQLAATLDQLAVAVHPSTIIDSMKAQATAKVQQTAGQAFTRVNQGVEAVKGQFTDEKGNLDRKRVVPAAAIGAALVVGVIMLRRRKK